MPAKKRRCVLDFKLYPYLLISTSLCGGDLGLFSNWLSTNAEAKVTLCTRSETSESGPCYTKISKILPKMLPVEHFMFCTVAHCVLAILDFSEKVPIVLRVLIHSLILANDNIKFAITEIREGRDLFDLCTTISSLYCRTV